MIDIIKHSAYYCITYRILIEITKDTKSFNRPTTGFGQTILILPSSPSV